MSRVGFSSGHSASAVDLRSRYVKHTHTHTHRERERERERETHARQRTHTNVHERRRTSDMVTHLGAHGGGIVLVAQGAVFLVVLEAPDLLVRRRGGRGQGLARGGGRTRPAVVLAPLVDELADLLIAALGWVLAGVGAVVFYQSEWIEERLALLGTRAETAVK